MRVYLVLLFIQVVFSINFIYSKRILDVFPALLWGSFRSFFTTVLAFLACWILGKKIRPSREEFRSLLFLSFIGVFLHHIFFLGGLSLTSATHSAILGTTLPLFTLLIAVATRREQLTPVAYLGFFLAFAGALVLSPLEHFSWEGQSLGDLLTLGSCLSYGAYFVFSKDFLRRFDWLSTVAWTNGLACVALTLLSLPYYRSFSWGEVSNTLWIYAFFAIVVASFLNYSLLNWTVTQLPSSRVALTNYFQPVLVAGIYWGFLGETIPMRTVVAMGLVFAGIFLALQGRRAVGVRLALPEDAKAIWQIAQSVAYGWKDSDTAGFLLSRYEEKDFLHRIKHGEVHLLEEGEIKGYVTLIPYESSTLEEIRGYLAQVRERKVEFSTIKDLLWLDQVAVHAKHGRSGVGTKLYEIVLSRFPGRPILTAIAEKPSANDPSVKFHEKFGFRRIGTFQANNFFGMPFYQSGIYLRQF